MNFLNSNNNSLSNKSKLKNITQRPLPALPFLKGEQPIDHSISLKGNIENFIGYAQIPVGLAGPLLVKGDHAHGAFNIPLATTEGALVSSYRRGMKATRLAGGISSICIEEAMLRSPYFRFESLVKASRFNAWLQDQLSNFEKIVKFTSGHCKLVKMESYQEANSVTLFLSYTTGDAAGQNMTTIATDAICKYIIANTPVQVNSWYIESNASGDKKATRRTLNQYRGKKVIAEVTIPREIVKEVLKSTPENMCQYFLTSNLASITVGAIGNTGHIANGLTAIYIACGQDVACIAESAVGILRMECDHNNDLYASLTLPALAVGTVGGGTGLATQSECLKIMECDGNDKAQKFAELCAATALAGELSIAAAIAEDHFTAAHKRLGRKK